MFRGLPSEIRRIQEKRHQAGDLPLCVQPPVAAVDAVSHAAGKQDCPQAAPRQPPLQKAPALVLEFRIRLEAVLEKGFEIVCVLVLPRILFFPLFKEQPVLLRELPVACPKQAESWAVCRNGTVSGSNRLVGQKAAQLIYRQLHSGSPVKIPVGASLEGRGFKCIFIHETTEFALD